MQASWQPQIKKHTVRETVSQKEKTHNGYTHTRKQEIKSYHPRKSPSLKDKKEKKKKEDHKTVRKQITKQQE